MRRSKRSTTQASTASTQSEVKRQRNNSSSENNAVENVTTRDARITELEQQVLKLQQDKDLALQSHQEAVADLEEQDLKASLLSRSKQVHVLEEELDKVNQSNQASESAVAGGSKVQDQTSHYNTLVGPFSHSQIKCGHIYVASRCIY